MDKIEKGLALFENNNVKLSYKFRMEYGVAHTTIFSNWKEKEREHTLENEKTPQTDIVFADYDVLTKDRLQIWNHIQEIINKTSLENELKENDMFIGLHITETWA